MSAKIKTIAVIYVLILAGIFILADIRQTQYLFTFIRNLPYGDKIGHFCLMGMFSFVVNLALNARTLCVWKLHYLYGSLIALIIVFIEEFSQIFVRGRTFDLMDLLADAAGIFIFGEIARLVVRKKLTLLRL